MEFIKIIQLDIYAFIILMIILFNEHKVKKQLFSNKIYMWLVRVTVILIVVDALAWVFNLRPGNANLILNWASNFALYFLAPLPGIIWMFYADFQIFHDKERVKRLAWVGGAVFAVNMVLLVMSLQYGWFFYIDTANTYHRGPLFFVHTFLCYSILVITFFLILLNRKHINSKHYRALLAFPLPPLLGSILQVAFYGLCLNWSCMTFSILIVYFNIVNMGLNTDYLTGVYNRRQLDSYLKERIEEATPEKTFASVLIDLDKFKQINDVLGHHAGDEALLEMVRLLRRCLRADDFIARFGGDEFYILLSINDKIQLKEIVERIRNAAEEFNKTGKPYQIDFSMGYDVYDPASRMTAEEFIKHLDRLMYLHKKKKNSKEQNSIRQTESA